MEVHISDSLSDIQILSVYSLPDMHNPFYMYSEFMFTTKGDSCYCIIIQTWQKNKICCPKISLS